MAKKRLPSPTEQDIKRIAETLLNTDDFGEIQDRDSFDSAFNDYLGHDDNLVANKEVRTATFKELQALKPGVSSEKVFSKAKGKQLHRDRQTTAQEVVTTKQEYIKKGASNVDLAGYDTKTRTKKVDRFNKVGRIKNQIVYVESVRITVRGKRVDRFRDKKGRFAKQGK